MARIAPVYRDEMLPGRRPPTRLGVTTVLAPALLAITLALWGVGLRQVDPAALNGWGLIRALSPPVLVSYPLLAAAAVAEIGRTRPRNGVLATVTAAAVVMIYGLQPAVESAARTPTGWLHAGFTTYIADHGHVLQSFDARFSWPGFFALVAMVSGGSGGPDPTILLNWAPPVFILLSALAVGAIARCVLHRGRAAWLATWLFIAADWTEQDYFSPQAIAYVLMLAAMAVILRYLVAPGVIDGGRVRWRDRSARPAYPAGVRIAAQIVVLIIVTAIAPTHQLTPYALAGLLLVLLLWRRLWPRWLAVLALVPPLVWLVLGARDYWAGNIDQLFAGLGSVGSTVSQGVTDRLSGDVGHEFVTTARLGLTMLIAVLAVAGYVVRRFQGHRTWTLPALALSPFGLALLQPYGGEVFIRSYLYALPWLAISGAIALDALLDIRMPFRRVAPVVIGLVLAMVATTTVFVRGGNDAYVSVTAADVRAMEYVYAQARPGDAVIAPLGYEPLRFERVGDVTQTVVGDTWVAGNAACTATEILPCLAQTRPAWVVINPQQENAGEILNGWPRGWTQSLVRGLRDVGYDVVFSESGSMVLHTKGSLP